MQPDQTMVVIYDRYFIFILFSILFLLIFSIFQFPSVVSAADDFFGIFPEDYYDPEDYGEKSTTVHEQLDVNNTIDQDNLITTVDKSRKVTSTLPEDSKDINFIAAGDWNCNKETQRTITKITNLEPELVLGLGDYTFQNVSPQCWFDISKPIDKILKIAIGNHDLDFRAIFQGGLGYMSSVASYRTSIAVLKVPSIENDIIKNIEKLNYFEKNIVNRFGLRVHWEYPGQFIQELPTNSITAIHN